MQSAKLRMVTLSNGMIAAWFPDQPFDGKLWCPDGDLSQIVRHMYQRRLNKQVRRSL